MEHEATHGTHEGKRVALWAVLCSVGAVACFVSGVYYGRGATPVRDADTDATELVIPVAPSATATETPVPPGSDPRTAAEPTPVSEEPPVAVPLVDRDGARTPAPPAPAPTSPAAPAAARPSTAGSRATGSDQRSSPPSAGRGGYHVQLESLPTRAQAEARVRALRARKFDAYVQPTPGTARGRRFRVRVGSFATRQEADAVASQLSRPGAPTPWVTR